MEFQTLGIDGPRPVLAGAGAEGGVREADDPFDAWAATLERLLQSWV